MAMLPIAPAGRTALWMQHATKMLATMHQHVALMPSSAHCFTALLQVSSGSEPEVAHGVWQVLDECQRGRGGWQVKPPTLQVGEPAPAAVQLSPSHICQPCMSFQPIAGCIMTQMAQILISSRSKDVWRTAHACLLASWCKQGAALVHVHAPAGPSQVRCSCPMSRSARHAQIALGRPACRYGGLWKNHHKDVSGRNKVPEAARAQGLQGRSSSPAREGAAAGAAGEGGGSRQALRQMLLADAASEDGADEDVSEADSEGEQQAAGEQVAAGAVAG